MKQRALNNEIVVIEGEAGIGKTRLLEQVMDDAEEKDKGVIFVEGDLANAQTAGHISNSIVKLLLVEQGNGDKGKESVINLVKDDQEIVENIHLLSDLLSIRVSFMFYFSYQLSLVDTEL